MSPSANRLPPAGRDLRLDTLRGLMLVAMSINHLNTELRLFTDYVVGFVSTAEGFVFLSGLVAGLVYTRRTTDGNFVLTRNRAWKRAGVIYGYHVASYLVAFCGLGLLAALTGAVSTTSPELFSTHPVAAVFLGPLLIYQPGLLDILPMYCAFMLALPVVLAALKQKRWSWLAAASAGLWLLAQFSVREHLQWWLGNFIPANFGAFDPLAWQLLFVGGAVFGYAWATSPRALFSFRPAMLALCLVVAIPLWLLKCGYLSVTGLSLDLLWHWADKTHLAPLRVVDFIAIAYLLTAAAAWFPRLFTVRPLAFLGQHSLPVFAMETTLCLFLLTQPALSETFLARTMTAVVMVGLLFGFAWLHLQFSTWQKARESSGIAWFGIRGNAAKKAA